MRLQLSREEFFIRGGILDKFLDTTFDRALIVDHAGKIIFFSKNSQKASGKSAQSVLGASVFDILPKTGFKKVIETGQSDEGIMTLLDGTMGIATHVPVFDGKELIGVIGMVYFNNIASVKRVMSQNPNCENRVFEEVYHSISRQFSKYTFDNYIGESQETKALIEQAKRAAQSKYPVLLIGETGTGKEILANAIHNYNTRTFTNPFVKINCSAIPSELLESELFGHEKGAFTGATMKKRGKFEMANNGSILLDEIGDMSYEMQTKLLRVLEEKEFERVGGNKLIATNARVIASTNVDLRKLSAEKTFREDLYYRLNTLEIRVPSLRERISDLPLIVNHLIKKDQLNIQFTDSALKKMMTYSWPGNVRQLRNVINRFSVMNTGEVIQPEVISEVLRVSDQEHQSAYTNNEKTNLTSDNLPTLEEAEKTLIQKALGVCKGNKSLAASRLAISRSTLNRKIKNYHIED